LWGQLSWCSDYATGYEIQGSITFPNRDVFSTNRPDCLRGQPSLLGNWYCGQFPAANRRTTRFHHVHRLRIKGALRLRHLTASWVVKRTNLFGSPRPRKPNASVPPQPHLACNFLPIIMKFVYNRCIFSYCVQFTALWTELLLFRHKALQEVSTVRCILVRGGSTESCVLQWHNALQFTVLYGVS
jgi:hypothetical protein